MISIVVAIGKNREIGKDNDLLWDIPEDRKRFRDLTFGHPVIWGRKTFESVLKYTKKPPNGRTHIIVTGDKDYKVEGCIIVNSLEDAIEKAKEIDDEIFIGGGGQIYKQAMESGIVDKIYLTIVDGEFTSDTFFPEYSGFRIIDEEEREGSGYKYKWQELEKISS